MFTGIVEGVGHITEMRRIAESLRLAIAPPFAVGELSEMINTDLDRALRAKEKSAVQKPDWR